MKKILLILINFVVSLNISAQDTVALNKNFSLPKGIYYTSKSFFEKKPDIDKPFEVVVNNGIDDDEPLATYGYSFKTTDSIKKPWNVFGFFDGRDIYIRLDDGYRRPGIFSGSLKINEFFKLTRIGRHPYIFITSASFFITKRTIGVAADDPILQKKINRISLYYFSKKKQFIKATPDGIGFLLREDKDFYEAYGNEPRKTNEILLKYLDKMNERYPNF